MSAAKQIAKGLSAMPAKFTTPQALELAEELGHAYRIATYHTISERTAEIEAVPEKYRANVRKRVEALYRIGERDKSIKAAIDSGQVVELTIGDKS